MACGRPVQTIGAAGGPAVLLRDAPVGAGGSRPLLPSTWAGVAARKPVVAQADGGATPNGMGGGKGGGKGLRAPVLDEEGFQLVVNKSGGRRGGAADANGAAAAPTAGPTTNGGDGGIPLPATPRADDGSEDVDMGGSGGSQPPPRGEEADDDGDEEAPAEEGPTEEELKERMLLDQRMVAWLKSQGLDESHPRRQQAERQAAESRLEWQGSRPRAAPSSRMRWAEEALLKARRGAARMEQSISELDDWYEEERNTRHQALREWRAKVRMREENLAEITRQAAEDYSPEMVAAVPSAGILQDAFRSLGSEVGPALEQIREATDEGSELQQKINVVLASVANLYGSIGEAVAEEHRQEESRGCQAQAQRQHPLQQQQPQQQRRRWQSWYEDSSDWQGHDEAWGCGTGATRYHIGECGDDDGGDWWSSQGRPWHGWDTDYWAGGCDPMACEGAGSTCMDTSEAQAPKWMRREAASAGDHGDRLWKKGRVTGADDEAPRGTPASGCAAAASSTTGAAAEGAADDAEALQARKEEVLKQATADGTAVDPAAIASMDRAQLEAWAKDNLL